MPWAKLWQDIRRRVDARRDHILILTVEEIRAATGTDQNIDKLWWWEMVANQTALGAEPLAPYGLCCEPRLLSDRVYAVTFTLAAELYGP
jgi:hypothetical protein